MGQAEDRVTEIEEHVVDLVSDTAGSVSSDPDPVAALRGTEYVETELRRLRAELLGLRAETAGGLDELRARLERLERSAG